jgi:hypothetical protein
LFLMLFNKLSWLGFFATFYIWLNPRQYTAHLCAEECRINIFKLFLIILL